ncbi:hypothetical protein A1O3_08419 [Capronia epimyces CBS 606.96]|uniref:Shikimate-5-dehydrogenase n=1 Tax=Capronia epimyces CBS 606.96 TaxID=1182542 RepID=W9Y973_9EURO|nr:uncharacterized protein A1O3_08419 [Capronia epimyces CBS 606.96]EXJ78919.1 hypothetical protein A1O3_08419 [Capronia epimyces CBS 606.96]
MASLLINGTKHDIISSNFANSRQTFIIPLAVSDVTVVAKDLERISYGGDAWELRVDLLQPTGSTGCPSKDYVAAQLEFLRQHSDLPVLFTIRTLPQGGKFPETAVDEALELMLLAADHGCEYIDVEFSWPASLKQELSRRKKSSKLIASFLDWTGNIRWTDPVLQQYVETNDYGDILQLSIVATDIIDCHEQAFFVRKYRENHSKPIIVVGMGEHGQLARVTGPVSFVTHPLIPLPSAPGQLSLAEIHQAQHLIGQLPRRNFYIFGNNISHSLSPTIHNAAFAELGLPYHYSIHETPEMDDSVREILLRPDFGGASVTYPHKRNIPHLLDSISEPATKLGAINTVIAQDTPSGRRLRGDNTDWIGILKCIQSGRLTNHKTGIVIGAGGAARAAVYAYQNLGVQHIALVNRTKEKAGRLAADFPSLQIDIYSSAAEAPAANVIVACIPADDIQEGDIPDHIFADGPGLVIEMAYRPPVTALMRVAKRHLAWKVLGGVDVLKEQAYAQFELWTGRRAPVLAIEEALDKALASHI